MGRRALARDGGRPGDVPHPEHHGRAGRVRDPARRSRHAPRLSPHPPVRARLGAGGGMSMEGSQLPARSHGQLPGRPLPQTNLADILERVLDKGIVIAGDIQINLLDIELLTIKLRLLIASVDRAREMGINWWESDPSLASAAAPQLSGGGDGDGELRK